MAESSGFIPVLTVAPAARACKSGAEKRTGKNALPQPFLVFDGTAQAIVGAIVIERCCLVQGDTEVTFVIGAAAALCSPVPLVEGDALYRSAVFKLRPEVEQRVRLSTTPSGNSLSFKLRAFVGSMWRVMRFSGDASRAVVGLTACDTCQMPQSVARLMGIKPDVVDSHASSIADVEAAVDGVFQAVVAVGGDSAASGFMHGGKSVSDLTREGLDSMSTITLGGAVSHRYKVPALLACVRLSANLKPQAKLGDALADAAEIMFGEASSSAQLDLRDGHRRLPSVEVLRMARVRLDMCSILSERLLSQKFTYRRSVTPVRRASLDTTISCAERIALRYHALSRLGRSSGATLTSMHAARAGFAQCLFSVWAKEAS